MNWTLQLVEQFSEPEFSEAIQHWLLGSHTFISSEKLVPTEAYEQFRTLKSRLDMTRIGVYDQNNQLIAFSFGFQQQDGNFHMAASAVAPEWRNQGIYRAIIGQIIELAQQRGYAQIDSTHLAANSPVIIAKLKLGFIITGMQVHPGHGLLVQLTKPLFPQWEDALLKRIGAR